MVTKNGEIRENFGIFIKYIAFVLTNVYIWAMNKTANLYARIEPDVKEQAEKVLDALGIPVSNAINMFYKQIILQQGIPFPLKLPQAPENAANWSKEKLDQELEKGYADMLAGRTKPAALYISEAKKKYKV